MVFRSFSRSGPWLGFECFGALASFLGESFNYCCPDRDLRLVSAFRGEMLLVKTKRTDRGLLVAVIVACGGVVGGVAWQERAEGQRHGCRNPWFFCLFCCSFSCGSAAVLLALLSHQRTHVSLRHV